MSRFFSRRFDALTPYTPGEQPRERKFVKLNTNESPYPPSPMALRLARQAAGDLQLYPDPECTALRQEAAARFGLKPSQILFVNGSDDALNLAFMAFCDETRPARFPDVTYGFYKVYAALHGVPYEEVPLREDFSVDPADYKGAGRNVFLANPNAPTGMALPLAEVEEIVASNPDNVVLIDEAYVDFGAESAVSLIDKYENLLVVQTSSKSRSLAGGRLGWALGNEALITDLNTLKYSSNPYCINRMSMAAGLGSFADEEYFRWCCGEIVKTREKSKEALRALGFEMTPSQANFLFVRHPRVPGAALYAALREKGVLVRHFDAPRLSDYNRITVGSPEEMETLIEALKEILK